MSDLFELLRDFIVYALVGMFASWIYFYRKNRALLGGFWGGAVIGTMGAVIISMLTSIEAWFIRLISWLMQPKLGDDLLFRVNLIAAVLGALLFVMILDYINHKRKRK